MKIEKSFITNGIALTTVGIATLVPNEFKQPLLYTGLFALSGAITNQLAIHMLFEKVPFLYGSGVIPERFEAFKEAIKTMMMEQFFTQEQLQNFFEQEEQKIDLEPIIAKTDFTPAFDALTKTVMDSSLGGMLAMFGGETALEPLREPFSQKMQAAIISIVNSAAFNDTLQNHLKNSSLNKDMTKAIEQMIDTRLAQLTPELVKELVQTLIKEHLGWLVVWGGVFGGVIGLVSSFFI